MAIRIRINGVEMEADSTQEAVDIYRQISGFNGHKTVHAPATPRVAVAQPETEQTNLASPKTLNDNAKGTLKLLMQSDSLGKPTKEVARAIGMEDARGMGAVTGVIRNWGHESFGLQERNTIVKEERETPDGGKVRFLKLTDAFRKNIKGRAMEIFGEELP